MICRLKRAFLSVPSRHRPKSARLKEREVLFVYAIIETGGKQYKVNEGDILFIEKLDVNEGDTVEFDRVKAVSVGDEKYCDNDPR